jgi:hypothetical protein
MVFGGTVKESEMITHPRGKIMHRDTRSPTEAWWAIAHGIRYRHNDSFTILHHALEEQRNRGAEYFIQLF